MKTNGKNLKMYSYSHHDYMDMYPEYAFATFKDQQTADQAIERMRSHYNSGTVSGAKEVTPTEFFKARQSAYWKGYEKDLDNAALDCTQDWLDEYTSLIEKHNGRL